MKHSPSALGRKHWTSRSGLSQGSLEFLAGELIGENARVEKSSCKGVQGLEGKIVDESRNTFVILTQKGRKTIPKKECVFFFPSSGVRGDGELLVSRPEDRTKKLARLEKKLVG
ncbi:MAG: ribonuclease P protein subunit [Candidatus Micrarchaeota archaeon]